MAHSHPSNHLSALAKLGIVALAACSAVACGSTSSEGSGGAAGSGAGGSANTGGAGNSGGSYNPDQPGFNLGFQLGSLEMMGSPMAMCFATFMPTAREDFEGSAGAIPLGTCVTSTDAGSGPSCTGDGDCAPEQQCLPEKDSNGQPQAGTERCVTPRELMDVGPMEVQGFNGGPVTLAYNAGQSGAYTTPGGDGSIPDSAVAYATTYTFSGAGDSAQGLGAYSGEVYMPPRLQLQSPPAVQLPIGIAGIEATVGQDLALVWSGSSDGSMTITLTGGSGSLICRVPDTGQFSIPASDVEAVGLGDMAIANMLTLERATQGSAAGAGITTSNVRAFAQILINVRKL